MSSGKICICRAYIGTIRSQLFAALHQYSFHLRTIRALRPQYAARERQNNGSLVLPFYSKLFPIITFSMLLQPAACKLATAIIMGNGFDAIYVLQCAHLHFMCFCALRLFARIVVSGIMQSVHLSVAGAIRWPRLSMVPEESGPPREKERGGKIVFNYIDKCFGKYSTPNYGR